MGYRVPMGSLQLQHGAGRIGSLLAATVIAWGVAIVPAGAAPQDILTTFRRPAPIEFDFFGDHLSVVGDQLLVGVPFDDTGQIDTGAALLFDSITGEIVQTFLNPTPEKGDYYGKSVGSLPGRVVIGSPGEDAVFIRDPHTADVLLLLEGFQSDGYFGHAVAAAGNHVLVGAFKEDRQANNSGIAYLFDADSGDLQQTFLNPTPANEDYFAEVLAATTDFSLIAAKGDDTRGSNAGAVYLFDNASGALVHSIFNPDPTTDDQFGSSVAFVGENKLLVGAPFADVGASNNGAAYLFDVASGQLLETFHAPEARHFDRFGTSLTAVGNHVLIGAPNNAGRVGEAFLFNQEGALLATFRGLEQADQFGAAVAAIGNRVVVGAPLGGPNSDRGGIVYLFAGVPEPTSLQVGAWCLFFWALPRRRNIR